MTHTHTHAHRVGLLRTPLDERSAKSQRVLPSIECNNCSLYTSAKTLKTFSGNASQIYYLLDMK